MTTTCLTDQTPTTLPSGRDLAEALAVLSAACESLVHLQWRVQRIARAAQIDDVPEYALVEGDEIPTFAHIGELYSFALDARARLDEAASYLTMFEGTLERLDSVRMMHAEGGRDA